jgi:hypothetical protein
MEDDFKRGNKVKFIGTHVLAGKVGTVVTANAEYIIVQYSNIPTNMGGPDVKLAFSRRWARINVQRAEELPPATGRTILSGDSRRAKPERAETPVQREKEKGAKK